MIGPGKDGKKSMETVQENPAVVPSSSSSSPPRQEADRRSGPISASHPDDTTNGTGITVNDDKKNDDSNDKNDNGGNDGHLNSSEDDDGDGGQKLPFSKAKCVALVATLTGASFLNVSGTAKPLHAYSVYLHTCADQRPQTLSIQVVVIILPTIGAALSIPESRLQWVVSAYALAFGCFLLLWGRVADVCGRRRVFVCGSAWVAAVTAANPFVPGEVAFDVFRALHGLVSFPLSLAAFLVETEKGIHIYMFVCGESAERLLG